MLRVIETRSDAARSLGSVEVPVMSAQRAISVYSDGVVTVDWLSTVTD
jgi:hypothetical protein